jgi:hypothetical protein
MTETAIANEASGGGRALATPEGVVERLTYVNPENGHNGDGSRPVRTEYAR